MDDKMVKFDKISMTTIEIARLTGKRHDHVMRDTQTTLVELYGLDSLPSFGECYIADNGQTYDCFNLPKTEVLILVSGYSIPLRAAIIRRLEDLESRNSSNVIDALNDPSTMRQLLLNYSEKVLALEDAVKEQAPKVKALDRISTADGSTCITDAAKALQMQPKALFHLLSKNGWIYRRAGGKGWIAYQNRIRQGVLEHKVTTVTRSDGTEKMTEQVLVTPKGICVLSAKIEAEKQWFVML